MAVRQIDDYRLSATAKEITSQWPPNPVWERIQWLDELRDAYDGEQLLPEGAAPVPTVRWCKWAAVQFGQHLTSSVPKLNGKDVTSKIMQAVVDMCRYGGALIWPDGDSFMVLDPRWWIPLDGGGWYYLVPQVSDTSRVVDHCILWKWEAGRLEVTVNPFSGAAGSDAMSQSIGGSIGLDQGVPIEADELGAPMTTEAAELIVVPALPMRGSYWGTPLIEAGVPWQEFAQARWAGLQNLSELIETPLRTWRAADQDRRQITGEAYDPGADGFDFDDAQADAASVLEQAARSREFVLPDAVQDVSYVQPTISTAEMFITVEECRREFEAATNTAGLSEQRSTADGARSGIAIKWERAETYNSSLSIQNQLREGIESGFGEGSLEWDHPWEQIEESGLLDADIAEPAMPPVAMTDEPDADR